ncbi:MAG: glycosyltransferase family 39 protein [Candidatus Micrarchaeota archaeon]
MSGFKNFIEKLSDRRIIIILVLLAIITRLPIISYFPFLVDEATYSIMISEQLEKPSLIPNFLGYPTFWKPILFYWVYAFFVGFLKNFPIPIEAVYRLPTELFGLANIIILYMFLRNNKFNKTFAFLMLLIYTLIFLNVYVSNTLFVDTMLNTFILGSLYFYTKENPNNKDYFLAFALSFGAYYVKLITAFIIPVLVIGYYYFKDKKILTKKVFILSLLAVPLAMVLQYFIYAQLLTTPVLGDSYSKELFDRLNPETILSKINETWRIFQYINMFLIFAVAGFLKYSKENKFMSIWFVIFFLTILTNVGYFWYYVTVLPPIAYFALMFLCEGKKENYDRFFQLMLIVAIIFNLVVGFFASNGIYEYYNPARVAGQMIVGKNNVEIIGLPALTTVAYKVIEEKRIGNATDFGWILFTDLNVSSDQVNNFINNYDYSSNSLNISDGSFSRMYWDYKIFRKTTSVKKFDYLVLPGFSEYYENISINGTILYQYKYATVIKIN